MRTYIWRKAHTCEWNDRIQKSRSNKNWNWEKQITKKYTIVKLKQNKFDFDESRYESMSIFNIISIKLLTLNRCHQLKVFTKWAVNFRALPKNNNLMTSKINNKRQKEIKKGMYDSHRSLYKKLKNCFARINDAFIFGVALWMEKSYINKKYIWPNTFKDIPFVLFLYIIKQLLPSKYVRIKLVRKTLMVFNRWENFWTFSYCYLMIIEICHTHDRWVKGYC